MGIVQWLRRLKNEKKVLALSTFHHKTISSNNKFPSVKIAKSEFKRSADKLFKVNLWTHLPGNSVLFQLYSAQGEKKYTTHIPLVNDYIKIEFSRSNPENWLKINDFIQQDSFVEISVSATSGPNSSGDETPRLNLSSTIKAHIFRIEVKNKTLYAYQIDRINDAFDNENKHTAKSTKAGAANGSQQLQWQLLTDYLVHKIEI